MTVTVLISVTDPIVIAGIHSYFCPIPILYYFCL